MASISLYNENQLCKIIEPTGAPNQLFYIHEVPEIVKILTGSDSDDINVKLELYPIVESTESSNIKELNVESLIVRQDCKNATFDFGKLFDTLFFGKKNDLNFISSFENSSNFKLSTVEMSNVRENNLTSFDIKYESLSSKYLQSHMIDTFRNVVLDTKISRPNDNKYFLSYNMILAWTEYIKTMYDEYVNTIWKMIENKFDTKQSDYFWNAEELLKTPTNVSKVVNNTYKNEDAAIFLNEGIFDLPEYNTSLNSTEQIKFKYAAESIYIIVSQPINDIVKDFENMLNTNDLFIFKNLTDDETKYTEQVPLKFSDWITEIHTKLYKIKTEVFKDEFNKDKSKLLPIYTKLKYSYILNKWNSAFIKNVDLILINTSEITSAEAKNFYELVDRIKNDSNRYVEKWKDYYDNLLNEFKRIRDNKPKSLENDLLNDLIMSISYENHKGDDTARIQKVFYEVFGDYIDQYKINAIKIVDYLNTTIDNKRIIPNAIETRFSKYEFKTVLDIVKDKFDDIFKIINNKETLTTDEYKNSELYNQIVSLYECSNNLVKYFNIFKNSIIFSDKEGDYNNYICEFDNPVDKPTVTLTDKTEKVFSQSRNNNEKLFDQLKTHDGILSLDNIATVINKLNDIETTYLIDYIKSRESYINKSKFTEVEAKTIYDNYCGKYSNKLMLFNVNDINGAKLEDNWEKQIFNGEQTPKSVFSGLLSEYYTNYINELKTQYEKSKDSSNTVDMQICINSLTNYLYDMGYYGKTNIDKVVSRTVIIDSSLNRTLSFEIPMSIDEKRIFEIIDELEDKIRKIEINANIDEEFKQQQFNQNVQSYKNQLEEYVNKCADEDLNISISNYQSLKTMNIPDEYKSYVFDGTVDYYDEGKKKLKTGSISAVSVKLTEYENELAKRAKAVSDDPVHNYDDNYGDFSLECSNYYNDKNNIISQYKTFLESEEEFTDILEKLAKFPEKIDAYNTAFENNKPQVNEEQPTDALVVGEEEQANKNM